MERSPTVKNVIYGTSETRHEVYSFVLEYEGEDEGEGVRVRVESKRGTGCTWPVHCRSTSSHLTCEV